MYGPYDSQGPEVFTAPPLPKKSRGRASAHGGVARVWQATIS